MTAAEWLLSAVDHRPWEPLKADWHASTVRLIEITMLTPTNAYVYPFSSEPGIVNVMYWPHWKPGFYVVAGHHRICGALARGDRFVSCRMFDGAFVR